MNWWIIGIGIVVVLVLMYFLIQYFDKEEEAYDVGKLSDMILEGKADKVKKKAKDAMEEYEAHQMAATKKKTK